MRAPAWAGNEKGSRQGAFGLVGVARSDARGFAAEAQILRLRFQNNTRTKKPGAVSRPGTLREFQFPE